MTFSEIVNKSIESFSNKMEGSTELKDAVASIRIVGEFSSGKTRFVKELFNDIIPDSLLPITSLEKQTYLPLEITYGSEVGLYLIERVSDTYQGKVIKKLSKFPNRNEQEACGFNQTTHRLRLEIPESRLIMPEGDGYTDDTSAMRYSIIDMPGWNAGDSEIAENAEIAMKGDWNIALIYVCKAIKLDSELNRKQLKDFLKELSLSLFIQRPKLFYLITDCQSEDRSRFIEREKGRLKEMLSEIEDIEDIEIEIVAVDFNSMSKDEKQQFRERFWKFIQTSESEKSGWAHKIDKWSDDMLPTPKLKIITSKFELAEKYLNLLSEEENYLKEILKIKKYSNNNTDINNRIQRVLIKHLGVEQLPVKLLQGNLGLPLNHPLYELWQGYFIKNYERIIKQVEEFLIDAEKIIQNTEATDNFVELILSILKNLANKLKEDLYSSFVILCRVGTTLSDEKPSVIISTLMALVLLDARLNDYLNKSRVRGK